MRGRQAKEITADDIERAARKIKILGSGFQVLSVGNQRLIQSVPCELNTDHTTVLVLAQKKGYVTTSVLAKELGWNQDRIASVLVSHHICCSKQKESAIKRRNGLVG
jgi:ESCRT-II complex subunit VPS22